MACETPNTLHLAPLTSTSLGTLDHMAEGDTYAESEGNGVVDACRDLYSWES